MESELKVSKSIRSLDYVLVGLVAILIIAVTYQTVSLNSLQSKLTASADQLLNSTGRLSSQISIFSSEVASLRLSNGTAKNTNSFGSTIANINEPLSPTQLSVINDAPQSYFEIAGQMFLNHSLKNYVFAGPVNRLNGTAFTYNAFVANGKPSVIYIGALSCIYCGENRWAMALALSQFGNFSALYNGYSSFNDGDLPTLYWSVYNYTTQSGVAYGNSYNSKYINFISADYESPVTASFQIQPLSYFAQLAPNSTYKSAIEFMNSTNRFQGTPFTLWGNVLVAGADAVIFGNTMPTTGTLPLTYMTHNDVLNLIKSFNSQFAYSEYAAADVYIAFTCKSLGSSNGPSICALPSIKAIQAMEGIS